MPWRSNKGPTEAQRCVGCYTRYWQNRFTRLCRQCEREQVQVAAIVAGQHRETAEALEAAAKMAALRLPRPPKRELTVGGVVFVVEWDGT